MRYFGASRLLDKTFNECSKLTEDSKWHHGETTLSHMLQVFELARNDGASPELQVAAFFHDAGKLLSIRGHEYEGIYLLASHGYHNAKVYDLILNHMRIRDYTSGKMKRPRSRRRIKENPYFNSLTKLAAWDKLGREVRREDNAISYFGILRRLLQETHTEVTNEPAQGPGEKIRPLQQTRGNSDIT
ncbi:HD domain-containing protein [Candidatus Pacearchaeota archaeon]|nr:HD domain-containing protein [Candidatus Pacearchaeota archaeon]